MLRMGRTLKPEAPENEKSPAAPEPATPFKQQSFNAQPAAVNAAAEAEKQAASRAVTESEALARDIREGIMSGFIGSSTVLTGEADFKGMLRIDGRFTGRIGSEKGTLIVSAGGHVEANIEVAAAKINGTVHGDITATERIEFGRTAHVRGNILTPALVIEHGAVFEGSCSMPRPKAAKERPAVSEPQTPKKAVRDERLPLPDKTQNAEVGKVSEAA
jgi:cytoskeletal protein CcmA (bactofilin family)